ncbi:MAG: hypothetical protein GTO40_11755 [Deltaproteobacteria bacterium]|nr:hypothetical protein [Deltaproteobacteria bacterium]
MIRLLKNSRGISLIEFLLNVVILIVLFTLAFPAYMALREKIMGADKGAYRQAGLHQNGAR